MVQFSTFEKRCLGTQIIMADRLKQIENSNTLLLCTGDIIMAFRGA